MSKKEILEEIEQYIGTLVLDMFDVVRLEGFIEDDGDYYYIMRKIKGGIYCSSCVLNFIPLKGKIDDDEYNALERQFEMNCDTCCPKCKTYLNHNCE